MPTLKELMVSDLETVFFNTDEYAEAATYIPKNGPTRSVTGIVDETIQRRDETNSINSIEEIWWRCGRDKDNATIGGIDTPQVGDGLKLNDGRVFSFVGDIANISPGDWRLMYRRDLPKQAGRTNMQAR